MRIRRGKDPNLYCYCANSPVSLADSNGCSYGSIVTGLMMAFGLLVGWAIGYALTAVLFQHLFSGYIASGLALSPMLMAVASSFTGAALGPLADAGDLVKAGQMSIAQFAKGVARALANSSFNPARAAYFTGLAFVVGIILGAGNAIEEYYASDYYMTQ